MATQTIDGHVQQRRDTASNWSTENPVLLDGEIGIETDTLKAKIGDGTTAWNSLSYAFGGSGGVGMTITELATGTSTVDKLVSAKLLDGYYNGTSTVERDENGDFMPKANPQPSFFFDIDENNDIMPRKKQILFDEHGDIIPM